MGLQTAAKLVCLFAALLLVAQLSHAAPIGHKTGAIFSFKQCGGAKKCLGTQQLDRIRRRSGQGHKSVDQLATDLDAEIDLGVDVENEMLIYACAGLEVMAPPDKPQGAKQSVQVQEQLSQVDVAPEAAAIEPQPQITEAATQAAALPAEMPSVGAEVIPDGPTGHHHHRHLMAVGGPAQGEIASGLLPSSVDPSQQTLTVAQVFSLHSRPSATRKILLDFDGHNTTGTAWNSGWGIDPIITPPYDKDGSPGNWSAAELSDIYAIWRAVSEDYAFFDVDVTTEDPGAAYLAANGNRAVIGGSASDWYGGGAGGVAYVGVYGQYNNRYQPAFIFTKNLGPDYAKYIWEAVSHEVGHNLGLSHDGQNTSTGIVGYYNGHGNWAPIMGVGYSKSVTQWSKGEYVNATNTEDDIAIIGRYLPTIPQDHGSNSSTATALVGTMNPSNTNTTARTTGIIRLPTDVDVFSFTANKSGPAVIQAPVVAPWGSAGRSNLNISLTLSNSAGNVLDSRSGVGIAPFQINLPAAGTYYLSVTSTGAGNPVNTGYSSYASRGQYELSATYPTAITAGSSPSPSPSPVQPSPSPVLPSPSPLPRASTAMTITAINITRCITDTQVMCSVRLMVIDSASKGGLGVAIVTGTWTSLTTASGFPYRTTTTTENTLGVNMGIATLSTFAALPAAAGNGCTFTLNSVSLTGYTLDAAAVTTRSVSW